MSAPTVTRPSATVVEPSQQTASVDWAQYARYGVLAAVILGAIGITWSVTVNYLEQAQEAKVRGEWDEVYKGLKEKKKPEERIAAFESIAENEKVKGTAAHAYALMQLAANHVDIAQNVKKAPDERAAAIARAISLYEFVAKTEPFKSNPSFGPFAVRNLALAYEQAQSSTAGVEYLDKAITTLSEGLFQGKGDNAPANPAMQSHYLFDPMRAQLGRLYWLRAQRKDAAAAKDDLDKARLYVNKALETPPSTEETKFMQYAQYQMRGGSGTAAWRSEAAYLKSLLDAPGKLLPDGKAPPVKEVKKEEKKDEAKKDAPKDSPKDAPKDAPKKDESKEKKTGALLDSKASAVASNEKTSTADEAPAPTQHLSYAQIQALLKQGKTAMCQCPRCDNGGKSLGAKLAE